MSDNKVKVTRDALLDIARKAVRLGDLDDQVVDIINMVCEKNHDYGDAWQRYGLFTPLIRINDKILRVANLSDGKAALVAEEGIADTLKDIVGYALLALLWLDNEELKSEFVNYGLSPVEKLAIDGTFKTIEAWKDQVAKSFGVPPEELFGK